MAQSSTAKSINARRTRTATSAFRPMRPITIVSGPKVSSVRPDRITTSRVGVKAFGMLCLPAEWVPSFFVVSADALNTKKNELKKLLIHASTRSRVAGKLYVRSSGPDETIEQRGRLESRVCTSARLSETLIELASSVPEPERDHVHWVVQQYVPAVRQGHLSNERRLSREARDFIAELQLDNEHAGHSVPIAVRRWRDGDETAARVLDCASELAITIVLKQVALWATTLPTRMLFEWVWSGTRIWVVQADAALASGGQSPKSLLPPSLSTISVDALTTFRIATETDFRKYRKLRNAQTYIDLHYSMPDFYILDDQVTMEEILSGVVPAAVNADLARLTGRTLIIRTDGLAIPDEMREMLPRSDHLRTPEAAMDWLQSQLVPSIRSSGLAGSRLCLIAHHFIPSVASAWAHAAPSRRIVRIESLWGLPEGLYWYSHDTYEIDTDRIQDDSAMRERLRYKGTFVAPDSDGRWVPFRTSERFDWARSVTRTEWLREIARTTRSVAEKERHPVAVMWFIDNDARATPHKVLPWFHIGAEIDAPKAAPRRKLLRSSDVTIRSSRDWRALQENVWNGSHVSRVSLEPSEPELVRNPDFAKELGRFCAEHTIVVELSGGVLSHAYHILRRAGAQVECVDLFGADEQRLEFNKLVRDLVPSTIVRKGESVAVVRLVGEALQQALRQKLIEEAFEALEARSGVEIVSELADVAEVIDALLLQLGVTQEQMREARAQKRERAGAFAEGLMLKSTAAPQSLRGSVPEVRSLFDTPEAVAGQIHAPTQLPVNRYQRPDVRTVGDLSEHMLTLEADLSRPGLDDKHVLNLTIPSPLGVQHFDIVVQISRHGSTLRAQVRVRPESAQMILPLV